MKHQELLDSAAAYALGALDESERVTFEAHLQECDTCRAEVDAYRRATGLLAHGAPAAVPPPRLRQRVLDDASRVRPLAKRPGARRAATPPAAWAALAAGLALAVAGGLLYTAGRSEVDRLDTQLAAAQRELASRDSTIGALLGPEVHVVSLASGDAKPAARVFWNHTRNLFIVTAHELPPAPPGRTYQLWAIAEGKAPVSMGTFNTDAAGTVSAVLPVGDDVIDTGFVDLCALTVEPEGGSPQPTEEPRLIGAWRHVD